MGSPNRTQKRKHCMNESTRMEAAEIIMLQHIMQFSFQFHPLCHAYGNPHNEIDYSKLLPSHSAHNYEWGNPVQLLFL